jgi:hypothetical protein
LSYSLVLGTNDFTNLNFALTPRNSALVQNLYELVLSRPADLDGFNQQLGVLNSTASNAGLVFQNLWASAESKALSRPIGKLIEAFFPGPLDVGMFRNAAQLQNLGVSQDATVLQILYSRAFVDKFGDTSDLSNTAFVNFAFQELLLRNPTNAERNQLVDQLQNGLLNRGQVLLQLVNGSEFNETRPNVGRKVGISLAYLGVLGREVTPSQLQNRLNQLNAGKTLKFVANQLAQGAEFQNLTGFTDTFIWDVKAHQIEPAVNDLSRLQLYDPATQQFDIPVTADSITSSATNPSNVYFLAHGWAPGLTEDVLLQSTPGNPLKWWQSEDSPWLLDGVDQISAEGIAQAIVDKDPLAKVIAFSWIDQSNTPETNRTTSFTLTGSITEGSATVTGVDTSTLVVGMSVTGPGMAIGAKVKSIDSANQVTLSQLATASLVGVSLTYTTTNLYVETQTGTTNGSAVISGLDTSTLWAGMTVAGPGIPPGAIIVNINSSSQVTLSANATAGTATLTFKGMNLGQELKEFMYASQSASYTQLNGLRLASAIQQALNISFFPGEGLIHLLGHSHGSKVATVAALALQEAGVPVSQLSLFESPEGGPAFSSVDAHLASFGNAQNYLWYYLRQMNLSRTPVQVGTRTPTAPTGGKYPTFVDNYFSHEGFGSALGGVDVSGFGGGNLAPIVDVEFFAEQLYGGLNASNPLGALDVLFGSHDYPPPWYAQASLQPPAVQQNGLNWSPLLNAGNSTGLSDFYQQAPPLVKTGNVTNGSAVVTNIDTTSLLAGMIVVETSSTTPNNNIPAGTTILSIDSPTQLTLSQPVGGNAPVTGESLTFTYSPGQYVIRQFELQTAPRPTASIAGPIPLAYAQQYTTGSVTDTGSEITLSVDADNSVAIEAITFSPLTEQFGPFAIGSGMDLQIEFSGVPAGEQVELVVWIRGLVSTPRVGIPGTSQLATLGSTVGYMSIPLLTLNGEDVGTAVQSATISLGSYLNADPSLLGPFNAVNNGSASTLLPTLGFTLIGDVSSQVSVTVSNMRQFAV